MSALLPTLLLPKPLEPNDRDDDAIVLDERSKLHCRGTPAYRRAGMVCAAVPF